MKNKRSKFSDRRLRTGMRDSIPMDSNGEALEKCRRTNPDRRVDNIQAALVTLNSQADRSSPGAHFTSKLRR